MHYLDLEQPEKNNADHFRFSTMQLNSNIKVPFFSRTVVTPSNRVYLIGGQDPDTDNTLGFVYQLDLKNRLLVNQSQMLTPRHSFAACVLNECIYVVGGIDQYGKIMNSVEKYDPQSNQWSSLEKCIQPCLNSSLVAYQGRLLFNIHSNGMERYEVGSNRWSSVQCSHQMNNLSGCVQINSNEILVMGGIDASKHNSQSVFLLSNLFNSNISVQPAGHLPHGGPALYMPLLFQKILFLMLNGASERNKQLLAIAKGRTWETL